MSAATEVTTELDRLGLEYEVMDCDPELADTAAFCEAYDVPLEKSANAILVASRKPEGHNAVCVVLAPTRRQRDRAQATRCPQGEFRPV